MKHHRNLAAEHLFERRVVAQDIRPAVANLAAEHIALVRKDAQNRTQKRGLSRAARADDRERLPRRKFDAHIVQYDFARHLNRKPGHRKQRLIFPFAHASRASFLCPRSQRGSKMSRSSSPIRLKITTVMKIAAPGNMSSHGAVCI